MAGCNDIGNGGNGDNGENGDEAACGDSGPNKGCKVPGSHMAVGYWGRDIYQQVFAEQEQARQRALLTDQIFLGGMLQVVDSTGGQEMFGLSWSWVSSRLQ